ncbi:glycoside hydrolase family 13 protein [Paenibacillaceae bacterium WGS1546]|uniref:glycoside hydrolase family 13 protein n=1 Tax=Cohnella sp. WGS1546 TaxID=3366810 RepID=UPI00372D7E12
MKGIAAFRGKRAYAAAIAAVVLIAVVAAFIAAGGGKNGEPANLPNPTQPPQEGTDAESGIRKEALLHDSWDERYRRPFGAVEQGTEVTLAFRTAKDDADRVSLLLGGQSVPMGKISSDDAYDYYEAKHVVREVGEFRYAFEAVRGDESVYYSAASGPGEAYEAEGAGDEYTLVSYIEGYRTPDWLKLSVTYQILPDRFRNGDPSNDRAVPFFYADAELQYPEWQAYDRYEDSRYNSVNAEEYARLSEEWGWDENWFNETYGGDLQGIEQKLDYLQSLGVKTIYLNPIFYSLSSHKYDTADYDRIDPRFGTEEDFQRLAAEAKKRGMFLVLDGSFNHVSNDSKYFNQYGKNYGDELGAYEAWVLRGVREGNEAAERIYRDWFGNAYFGEAHPLHFRGKAFYEAILTGSQEIESPYDHWFTIHEDGSYDAWEGIPNFVQLNTPGGSHLNLEDFAERILGGPDALSRKWIENGASGWRLDVSPQINIDFWNAFRDSIRGDGKPDWPNGDPVMIAENWEDSTTDFINGTFDSTQNYLFRSAAISFVLDESYQSRYDFGGSNAMEHWTPIDAFELNRELMTFYEKYPKETSFALLNAFGNHDVPRILTVFGHLERSRPLYPGVRDWVAMELDISHDVRNVLYLDDFVKLGFVPQERLDELVRERNELAERRLKLATILQMGYPGSPTIYYGDEAGHPGQGDPDNRKQMNWERATPDNPLWAAIAEIAGVRSDYQVLKTGELVPLSAEAGSPVYAFGRSIQGEADALGRSEYIYNYATGSTVRIAEHNGRAVVAVNKDRDREQAVELDIAGFAPDGTVFEDRLNGGELTVRDGRLSLKLGPLAGSMLIEQNTPKTSK